MRAGIAVLLLCGGALGLALGVAPDLAPGGGWQRWQAWRERDEAPLLREPEPPPLRFTGVPRELEGRGQFDVWTRLGSPDLVRREGPARVRQYTRSGGRKSTRLNSRD